ncbi:MAG: hypothetical protein JWN61_1405 [Pseudonocardiales bacterium]|nr:hypothetical protein [Pseudonocardiales bacterium]
MIPVLQYGTTALALVVALAAGVCAAGDRLPGWPTAWAIIDRKRYGTAVIVVACLAVTVMLARTHQIWDAGVACSRWALARPSSPGCSSSGC